MSPSARPSTATVLPPTEQAAEAPSGKDAAYENFPVGSWLLSRRLRPHVATFYAYARAIDDIADHPDLSADEKVTRLSGFAAALEGATDDPAFAKSLRMRQSLIETGVSLRHCLDLIAAFKQDAIKLRYKDWDDLMGYCTLSAAPVGRYLLDLHGGSRDGYGPSDALCMALQVINHLQDCREDYLRLDRVYLPLDWLEREGATVTELAATSTGPELRRVLDAILDATERLMMDARKLPKGLASKRLALESGAIIAIADRLIALLRACDPLAQRIRLSKVGFLWCCARGAAAAMI